MKNQDLFKEIYSALLVNKVRSGLTMLGVVIGISSVIAMISIGKGSQSAIEANIQSLGSNLVMIMPSFQRGVGQQVSSGRGSAQTLTLDDAQAISKEISFVKAVDPEISNRYQIKAKANNTNTQVIGITGSYFDVRNVVVEEGNQITDKDVQSYSRVAVLGPTTKIDLFGEDEDAIGKTIRIKNLDFKVVGITQAKGGSGFSNRDDMVLIPISIAQRYLSGNNRVGSIYVQAVDQKSMAAMQQEINELLLVRHKIAEPTQADFSVLNQEDIIQTASSVANTFTLLLASIAAISLIVGGIGIMNMMLTTVTERTREIGLRKAIGAKSKDINLQFLSEAILLTFIGGIIGVFFGWLASLLISYFGSIKTEVSFFSILLAFGVSAAIGIVFGYYPARHASKLNPIEALRYE